MEVKKQSKTFCLHSYPHLWSWSLRSDWKRRLKIQGVHHQIWTFYLTVEGHQGRGRSNIVSVIPAELCSTNHSPSCCIASSWKKDTWCGISPWIKGITFYFVHEKINCFIKNKLVALFYSWLVQNDIQLDVKTRLVLRSIGKKNWLVCESLSLPPHVCVLFVFLCVQLGVCTWAGMFVCSLLVKTNRDV